MYQIYNKKNSGPIKFPQVGKPVGGETTLPIPPTWNITSRPLDQPSEYSSLNTQKPKIKNNFDIIVLQINIRKCYLLLAVTEFLVNLLLL